MTAVKLSAQFKKDERENNGLNHRSDEMVKEALNGNPMRYVVVAVVEVSNVDIDVADGNVMTPTVRTMNIEIMEGDAATEARSLMNAAFRARTGRPDDPQGTLFDALDTGKPAENDPTAGPWFGDADYVDPDAAVAVLAGGFDGATQEKTPSDGGMAEIADQLEAEKVEAEKDKKPRGKR